MTPNPLRLAQFMVAIVCSTGKPNHRTHTCQNSKGHIYTYIHLAHVTRDLGRPVLCISTSPCT